jgi:hypothetical protein
LSGPGLILEQREGRFAPVPLGMEASYDFGGAAFGDLVTPGVSAIFVAVPGEHMVFEYRDDAFPFDLLPSGNELRETNPSMFLPVIEDLNMDGYPDVFVASGEEGGSYYYIANRGYGSFMMSDKYGSNLFPKPEASATTTAMSLGDFNRDGATDVLLGTAEGSLILLVNETLAERPAEVDPRAGRSETQKQVQAKIVRFLPPLRGQMPGALLEIRDEQKQLVFSKPVVGLVGSGSQSAPEVLAVLREPGRYTVSIRLPNGESLEGVLELQPDSPRVQIHRVLSE